MIAVGEKKKHYYLNFVYDNTTILNKFIKLYMAFLDDEFLNIWIFNSSFNENQVR